MRIAGVYCRATGPTPLADRTTLPMTAPLRILLAILLTLLAAPMARALEAPDWIKIGVLTHRGEEATLQNWSPTADYLSSMLPDYLFEIEPLDFEEVDAAVAEERIDFVLVNSGMYVTLEVSQGVSRIATLNNFQDGQAYNRFGGVLFTRADRTDLTNLSDLRGMTLSAVNPVSLGGYQMVWRELRDAGIDPHTDLGGLTFENTHDAVVERVLAGRADAGTVRTDILERMIAAGTIEVDDFRIIAARTTPGFTLHHSTRLYPEWPFARTRSTPIDIAQQVAVALLQMPVDHPAARHGGYAGWSVPLEYQPVHELFQELSIGPYSAPGPFTLVDVVKRYRVSIFAGALSLGLLLSLILRIAYLNKELQLAKQGIERHFELLLKAVSEGICGVDPDGLTTFVNPAMERITGWSPHDLIGRPQHMLLHHTRADGSDYPEGDCLIGESIRDGEIRRVDNELFWRKDGTSFPVEYSSAPLRDESGNVLGAVVVFHDISDRLRIAEELRQHQVELAHVARLSTLGEMASEIAHELNQPLSAITNYTNASIRRLRNTEPGTRLEIHELVSAMKLTAAQAHRAAEIVRQLRNFIRKKTPGQTPVDINDMIHNMVTLLGPEARTGQTAVDLDLAPEPPVITGHAIELEQVLLNLTRNAIEAMQEIPPAERRLRIHTAATGAETVLISVTDRGRGIDAKRLQKVFTPFYTTKRTGLGLGLAICRRIIDAHGGKLWAEPNPGGGTTFHIELSREGGTPEP